MIQTGPISSNVIVITVFLSVIKIDLSKAAYMFSVIQKLQFLMQKSMRIL